MAFLDFVLADNDFGDLEGVPLLFTEATAPKDVQYSESVMAIFQTEDLSCILPWQDMTAGTQPFTLSGTSMLFVPEATSPVKFWQFLKEASLLPGWGGVPTASTGLGLSNMKNQWHAMAFLPFSCTFLFECASDAALLQKAYSKFVSREDPSEFVSFRSKDHECRIYVDKVNTSWQFKAASQALSNSKSLACSFWLNAWISFNKRYWPDQRVKMWCLLDGPPTHSRDIAQRHRTGSRAHVDTKHNTPLRPRIQCVSLLYASSSVAPRVAFWCHCTTKRLYNVQDSFGEQTIHKGKCTAWPTQAQKNKHMATPWAVLSIQLAPTIPNDKIAWFPM